MAHSDRPYNKPTPIEANGEALFTRIREKSEHWEHELKKYGDNADQYIRKNPVKSTIMAGIAGLLLGKFLSK